MNLDIAIDVSHNNGQIDWPLVYGSGIRIAMIKATEGGHFVDPMFETNTHGAEAAGIAVIPYHFLNGDNPDDQVSNFSVAASLASDNPEAYALDWERSKSVSPTLEVQAIGSRLQEIVGRPPMIYMGIPAARPGVATTVMESWPLWVARYRNEVPKFSLMPDTLMNPGIHTWMLWQYTSKGNVSGITGLVDRSVANFLTADDAVRWVRSYPFA